MESMEIDIVQNFSGAAAGRGLEEDTLRRRPSAFACLQVYADRGSVGVRQGIRPGISGAEMGVSD